MDKTPVQKNIPFRFIAGTGLLLVLALTLMSYLEEAHRVLEIQSVKQQKRVIESALVVVFSTYAVEGRLHELQELDGANPFEFLEQYQLAPGNYFGASQPAPDLATGWYFDEARGEIFFQSLYMETPPRYRVEFDFVDNDANAQFDKGVDVIRSLRLIELGWL